MTLSRIFASVVGGLAGGWMIFDGIHVLLRGKYFGPDRPGPWSAFFTRIGVDPFRLGPMFVILGACWIAFMIAMLAGRPWGWYGAVVIAILSLWYFPLGTVLSLIYLGLLFFGDLRR